MRPPCRPRPSRRPRPRPRRLQRLASPGVQDERDSLGCVVVAPAFYDQVVAPTSGARRSVVYVLPEDGPVRAMFGTAREVAGP